LFGLGHSIELLLVLA